MNKTWLISSNIIENKNFNQKKLFENQKHQNNLLRFDVL